MGDLWAGCLLLSTPGVTLDFLDLPTLDLLDLKTNLNFKQRDTCKGLRLLAVSVTAELPTGRSGSIIAFLGHR